MNAGLFAFLDWLAGQKWARYVGGAFAVLFGWLLLKRTLQQDAKKQERRRFERKVEQTNREIRESSDDFRKEADRVRAGRGSYDDDRVSDVAEGLPDYHYRD